MKKIIYTIPLLFLLLTVASCQDDKNEVDGHGYLQLSSVEVNKNVVIEPTSSVSRMATRADETNSIQLALDILKGDEVVKHVDNWTQLRDEAVKLEIGEYTLRAYSFGEGKNKNAQGVEAAPFYMGETTVTIQKDVNKTAEIKCTLSQCMVSLSYSANFKKAFPTYEAVLSNSFGPITLASTETRSAYMGTGVELKSILKLTNADGDSFEYPRVIAEKAQSHYHYKVNYDVTNEGSGEFVVEVDPVAKIHEITVTIPVAKAPEHILTTASSNAWGQFAYMSGTAILASQDAVVVFKYRKKDAGDDAWVEVSSTLKDGIYEGKTEQIEFGAEYEYAIAAGEQMGTIQSFTTEAKDGQYPIENLSLDAWSIGKTGLIIKNKPFVTPNANKSDSYWATGNSGAIIAGESDVTTEVAGAEAKQGSAAKLKTITGVLAAGSAAGNLFIGSFNTSMTNPSSSVKFGRDYSGARPTKLSGWYQYDPQPISFGVYPQDRTDMDTDEAHIYIRLWDAEGNVIAYGEMIETQKVSTYKKFDIDINYSNLTAKPAKITIVATSSRYGGEFEPKNVERPEDGLKSNIWGKVGAGSTLWVDEFELSYYK